MLKRTFLASIAFCATLANAQTLLLHYTYDEEKNPVVNHAGETANGSLINGGSFSDNTPWGVGSSYYSTGSNSYIQASGPSLMTDLNALTFSTWVNFQESPVDSDRIFTDLHYNNGRGFDLRFNSSGNLLVHVNNKFQSTGLTFTNDEWTFLAVTYEVIFDGDAPPSGLAKVYTGTTEEDVTLFTTLTFETGTILSSNYPMEINGSPASSSDRSIHAYYDDTRLYDGALDIVQLESLRVGVIPEPSTYAAMAGALALAIAIYRKQRNKA